jgi:WhiB family transcriptional regulator, redox-sensing transcriptional regulator
MRDAACKGMDLAAFFPVADVVTPEAAEACEGCPVREKCASYAVTLPVKYGTWGGMSEAHRANERRKLLRKGEIEGVAA